MPAPDPIPVGKLPAELLASLLQRAPISDPRVILGPGIGLDCAILDLGEQVLVLKSDPITFTTGEIGWYAVQVNANDIATTGATPRWLLVTSLLPEGRTSPELVESITSQLFAACQSIGVSLIGGHTEITHGLDRPILAATMIGEVAHQNLVTPAGAKEGDAILLTKGVPIEGTAILASELPKRLSDQAHPLHLSQEEVQEAQNYLHAPGISVLKDAQLAINAGRVHAMHDPTEGGLLTAVWEMALACQHSLEIDLSQVYISQLSSRICKILKIDPLATIASGALLLAVDPLDIEPICIALEEQHIHCSKIGVVLAANQDPVVWSVGGLNKDLLPYPKRDAIASLFET